MIAFGCAITEPEPYVQYAGPGIRATAEPDSEVFAFAAIGSIGRSYNVVLDAAAAHPDLEALVLVHEHAELADPDFCAKVRAALRDPEVGVVGAVGATGVRTIAWWEGAMTPSSVVHAYEEHGGGELPAFGWTPPGAPRGPVDSVDGLVLVLSPWAVRSVRFDEGLALGQGFDLDYCLQVRAAGRTVVAADLRVVHHRSLQLVSDVDLWVEAHRQVAAKWDGRMPGVEPDDRTWHERARRAEAEREAARALAYSRALAHDARITALERAMAEATATASWRLTAPLRRANALRRRLRRAPQTATGA